MKGIILQISVFALGIFLILGSGGGTTTPGNTSLSTPTNVIAASAYKGAVLTWNAVTSADSYQVCYATESITDFSNCTNYEGGGLQTATTNSAVITSLTEGQPYYFSIIAKAGNVSSSSSMSKVATPSLGLNDTGVALCGSGVANNLNCPILGYVNQDAQYGLDAQSPSSVDGDAGFNFTKLDSSGAALASSANSWACVKDNITGLIWESKTLNNKDDLFQWYSSDSTNNAGSSGHNASGESICVGFDASDPTSYCNTEAYVDRVNAGSYCGITNWRMPNKQELNSIVNYNSVEPAIDFAYFENTSTAVYWSGTPSFSSSTASDFAWAISFQYGGTAKQNKDTKLRVRLVSDGQ